MPVSHSHAFEKTPGRLPFDKRPPDLHQTPRRDETPNFHIQTRDDDDDDDGMITTRAHQMITHVALVVVKPVSHIKGLSRGASPPPSATGNGALPSTICRQVRGRCPETPTLDWTASRASVFRSSILHGGAGCFAERTDTVKTFSKPTRRLGRHGCARKKQRRCKEPNHSIVDHDGDIPSGMCFASRDSRHRHSSATGQATGVVVVREKDGNIGTIPHPLTVGLVSASPRQTHAPQLFGQTDAPATRRNGTKDMGGGRASRPGTLVPGCSTFDATSFKTCISALRCAFPPSSTWTARPPPLSGMLTNKSAVAGPPATPSLALIFSSCPSNGSALELRITSRSGRRASFEVHGCQLASPPLTHTHTHTHTAVWCMRHAARGTPIAAPDTRQLPDLIGTCPPRRLPVDHGVTLLSPFPQRQPGDHLHLQDDVTSPQFQLLPAGRASNTKEKEETKTETARNLSPEKKKTPPRAAGSVSPRDLLVLIGPQLPRPPNKQTATHSSHPEDGVCACPPCVFVVSLSTKLADVRAIRETTPGIRPSGKERKYGTAGPGKHIGPGPPALPAQTRVCVRDDQMLPRGTSTTGTRARRRTARCVCYPPYCHPSGSDRVESSHCPPSATKVTSSQFPL